MKERCGKPEIDMSAGNQAYQQANPGAWLDVGWTPCPMGKWVGFEEAAGIRRLAEKHLRIR